MGLFGSKSKKVNSVNRLEGTVQFGGDKSISHRYAMLAAIANGESEIHFFSPSADCQSTLNCLKSLGVKIERKDNVVKIAGVGLDGLRAPSGNLDAGNSGSTIRMLSGILAGQPFAARVFGDESLSRRPMQRVMKPLAQMGARIDARDGQFPPLRIEGGRLRAIDYTLPVPSAQVKTCVLFAGLYADGSTTVTEPIRSRDHTEIARREFGADIAVERQKITIAGRPKLEGRELVVPSDLSSRS